MSDTSTLLKAAETALPQFKWLPTEQGPWSADYGLFNPHDPTKGDLAALNEALERNLWSFWFDVGLFKARRPEFDTYDFGYAEAKTPAERALKCVEATP